MAKSSLFMILDTPIVGSEAMLKRLHANHKEKGHCGLALEELPPLARTCVEVISGPKPTPFSLKHDGN